MTGSTVFIDGLLAEIFRYFPSCKVQCQEICLQPPVSSHYHPYHLLTDVTDVTLGTSDYWLGTRTGASGTNMLD